VSATTVLTNFTGTLVDGRVVTRDELIVDGWIQAEHGRITAVGSGAFPPGDSVHSAGGRFVFPGFVDLHCHGGGGFSFDGPSHIEQGRAAEFHRHHGSTSVVASLISAPHASLKRSCELLGRLVREEEIVGIHLEGPYLSRVRCGAHNPVHLRLPSIQELAELVEISQQTIVQVTIAPELPGALDAIRWLVEHNVIAAVGHTDAGADQVRAGIDAGATLATHLCNAMPAMRHREPSAVPTLLDDERVVVELINDEVHVHPTVVRMIAARAGRSRLALITDAIAAAGQGNGTFELGGQAVVVTGGVARLAPTDDATPRAIAGSTLTMDVAVRNALRQGFDPVDVGHAAAGVGARVLGLADRGAISIGMRADLVLI
jgi:N-acetylglucosamine-6-phosphate deacetylase